MTFQRLSCGVATLHRSHPLSLKPENKTGWLGQYAPGLQRRPLTSRLSCGVATLRHSHPISLKPENKTGWLGQNTPGTWAYDLSEALLWCRYAPPQPPNPTQAREQNGVAGAVCPRVATPAFDVLEALLWCRYAPPQPPLFRGRKVSTLRSPLWRNSIGNQVARRISLEPARTRPAPVAGLRHKATPDGVHVDVVDHRHQGPGFPDVPIESAT